MALKNTILANGNVAGTTHERGIGALDRALRQPQMAPYLTGIQLP
jgi:hypothetical protein